MPEQPHGLVFISYRRETDWAAAGRLYDKLIEALPKEHVFMDIGSIRPGTDFVRDLDEKVADCDILLAVIGKEWLFIKDEIGLPRLDNPNDFVRIEIASALERDKRIIPVLMANALVPSEQQLPLQLKPLARRNAIRLTQERFSTDVQDLVNELLKQLDEVRVKRLERLEAARREHELLKLIGGASGSGNLGDRAPLPKWFGFLSSRSSKDLNDLRRKVWEAGEAAGQLIYVTEYSAKDAFLGKDLDFIEASMITEVLSAEKYICILDGGWGTTWNESQFSTLARELIVASMSNRDLWLFLLAPFVNPDPRLASILDLIRLGKPNAHIVGPASYDDILAHITVLIRSAGKRRPPIWLRRWLQ